MSRPIRILSRLSLCAALASTASLAHAQAGYPQYGVPQGYAPQYGVPQYGVPQGYGPQYGAPQYGAPQGYDPQYNAPQANPNGRRRNNGRNRNNGGDNAGVIPLPKGVSRVIGIDAQNMLLVEMEPEVEGAASEYRAIPVQHVYVGGIAKLFGGETISTEEFVSPAFGKGQSLNTGNNPQGNFGGANGFGAGPGFYGGFNPYGSFGQGGYPVGGVVTGPNGQPLPVYPNGVPGVVPGLGFGGGFVGSPQITFGIDGSVTTTQITPNRADTSTSTSTTTIPQTR